MINHSNLQHHPNQTNNSNNNNNNNNLSTLTTSSNDRQKVQSITRLNQNQRIRSNHHQTFSHLLGFTLPPRSNHSNQPFNRRPIRKQHLDHPSYQDKDHFVHTKYRFVLKPTGDYTVHLADPDIRFNWPDILQVIVNVSNILPVTTPTEIDDGHSDKQACPICLSDPSAARMTKCGHIFCYPCILHYIELSDEGKGLGRKCPVCWEAVLKKDLKSVKWVDSRQSTSTTQSLDQNIQQQLESDSMTFRLIERPNFTSLALPRSPTWPSSAVQTHQAPWQFTPDALGFAKFVIASPDYMISELKEDLQELENELALLSKWSTSRDATDDLSMVFIRTAQNKVQEQIQKVDLLKTNFVMTERKRAMREIAQVTQMASTTNQNQEAQLQLVSTTDEDESIMPVPLKVDDLDRPAYLPSQSEYTLITGSDLSNLPTSEVDALQVLASRPAKSDPLPSVVPKTRKNVNPPEPTSTTYRFYQAASGEPIFLSALDVRVLLTKFGSFDRFPDSITLKVEGWSESRVTDEFRRRCRYLSHLPTGSEVKFIEADTDEYLVDDCSLMEAVRKRRSKRKEKVKKEDKAKMKSEMIEQSSWHTTMATTTTKPARPDWTGPENGDIKPGSFHHGQNESFLSEEPALPATLPSVTPTGTGGEPSGSRTVWGTYIPTSRAEAGGVQEADDIWAKHEKYLGLNKSRRGVRAELNVEDLDDSDEGQEGEGQKKKNGADRKKGKQKNRKHVNKVVINLSGGTGGRRS